MTQVTKRSVTYQLQQNVLCAGRTVCWRLLLRWHRSSRVSLLVRLLTWSSLVDGCQSPSPGSCSLSSVNVSPTLVCFNFVSFSAFLQPCTRMWYNWHQVVMRPHRSDYVQGDHFSWKVMEFSKTIFQAWKVIENSQGHGMSWKMMMMSWIFL